MEACLLGTTWLPLFLLMVLLAQLLESDDSEDFDRFLNWSEDFDRWKSEGFFPSRSSEPELDFLLERVDTELPMACFCFGGVDEG